MTGDRIGRSRTMTDAPEAEDHDSRRVCGAPKRQGEGNCRRPAGWGTDHPGFGPCKLHGGSTTAHRKHAQRVQAEQAVATFGLPRDIDPHRALLEEVHRAAGAVQWLQAEVAGLDRQAVTHGVTRTVQLPDGGRRIETEAAVNPYVRLLGEWSDRLVRACRAAIDGGVSERLVRLEEDHGRLLVEVLRRVFDDPDLSDEQRDGLRRRAARELRVIAGEAA